MALQEKILQQLVNIAGTEDEQAILEILKAYDFTVPSSTNVETLVETFSRDDLQKTVNYINENYRASHPVIIHRLKKNTNRNKATYALNVKCFLNGILPVPCATCNTEYIHTSAANVDENNIVCVLCNRFSHKGCIIAADLKPGIAHVCFFCQQDLERRRTSKSKETSDTGKDQLNISNISRRSSVDGIEEVEDNEEKNKQKDEEERKIAEAMKDSEAGICALYYEGKCPHGMRGRNCEFEHPKKCKYYCDYGNEYPRGCRRGRKCWYFHPKLCQNSLQMKACLNRSCTFQHLLDTRRSGGPRHRNEDRRESQRPDPRYYEDREFRRETYPPDREPRRETRQPESRRETRQPERETRRERQQPNPWQHDSEANNSSESNKPSKDDFLMKYLEKMKSDLKNDQTLLTQKMQTQVAQQVQTGINQAISAMQLQQPNIMPQPQQVFIRQPPPPHV